MIGYLPALRQHLPKHRPADGQPVVFAVGTRSPCCHPIALEAVERHVDLERGNLQRAWRDLVKDLLSIEGTVVLPHARMIAPYNEMAAAIVLTKHGVKQRLSRTRVTHLHRIAGLDTAIFNKIVLYQRVHRPYPHLGWNIPGFKLSHQLVDQYPVAYLYGDLREVLMRAVHRIP